MSFWQPRKEIRIWDLATGHDGHLSLTKVSLLGSLAWATVVLTARLFWLPPDQGPSDELVWTLVGIFALKQFADNSRWSARNTPEEK